jgi:hypothetical protein
MRDTIEMARAAGLLTWLKPPEDVIERFKTFEALVRADEREACAKVCEDMDAAVLALLNVTRQPIAIAAAIRTRGETK